MGLQVFGMYCLMTMKAYVLNIRGGEQPIALGCCACDQNVVGLNPTVEPLRETLNPQSSVPAL